MIQVLKLFSILVMVIVLFSCNQGNEALIINKDSSKISELTGAYLGQEPPGKSPEVFAAAIISTGAHEMSITISDDLKDIYIGRSSLNWNSSIVHFKSREEKWINAGLGIFTSGLSDNYPFLSPGNNRIYFNSSRLKTGFTDNTTRSIWFSDYTDHNWSEPVQIEMEIDPSAAVTFPSVANSGNIYFNATSDGGFGHSDIYFVKKKGRGYGKPHNLGKTVNSENYEFHPYISPGEDILIFDAVRPDGYGSNDIYISFRKKDGSWTSAVNMGSTINSESADMRPYLSPDGKYLFFCSNRPGPISGKVSENVNYDEFSRIINGAGNGSQDIYWVDADIIEQIRNKELK